MTIQFARRSLTIAIASALLMTAASAAVAPRAAAPLPVTNDVNGDAKTDRTMWRPSNQVWYSALNGGGFQFAFWGTTGDRDVMGQFDGDVKADVAIWRPSTGQWWIFQSQTGTIRVDTLGSATDVPLVGDVDGDHIDDIAVWNPTSGLWQVKPSTGGLIVVTWGTVGDRPILADYTGDGLADLTIYRPANGTWYSLSTTGTSKITPWGGAADDVPVVGDFDGDGTYDPAVFRSTTGVWYVLRSTLGVAITPWGAPGDIPVRGDFDGDGTSDYTIWRPRSGAWWTFTTLGAPLVDVWGLHDDKPVGRATEIGTMPVITSTDNTTFTVGTAGTFTVTATGTPAPILKRTGDALPGGVNFTDNADGTATLSGTPDPGTAGVYHFVLLAQNSAGPDTQNFTLTVSGGPNNLPTLDPISDPAAILEDAPLQTVNLSGISAGGEASQPLQVTATSGNTSVIPDPTVTYTSPNATGSLAYTPVANASGSALITVTVTDGGPDDDLGTPGDNGTFLRTFTVAVTPVNDAPSFTKGADQTMLEDAGVQTVNGWATAISAGPNEGSQTVTFVVTNNTNASLFSTQPAVSPAGALTFTPAANQNGTATITLKITDDGGTANGGVNESATQSFVVNVTAVNDAPSFTVGANQSVNENAGAQSVVAWATGISTGPSDEAGQTVAFVVTNNTNPGLFSAGPAVSSAGTLSYTSGPGASGSATITLKITDSGGTANGGVNESPTQQFTITINPIPDPPTASPDSYQFVGNTTLEVDSTQDSMPSVFVNSANGVLANDSDPDSGFSIVGLGVCPNGPTPLTCASAGGGSVTLQASGQFVYTPPSGGNDDSFTYRISDGVTTVTGTVTLTRSNRVWYVKNNATAGGLGRSSDPFDTLLEAQTVSLPNEYIFVFFGDGTTLGQAAGFALKDGQHLLGEFSGLSIPVALNGGASPTVLVAQPAPDACGGNPCRPMLDDVAGGPQGVHALGVIPAEIKGLNLAGSENNALVWSTTPAFAGAGTVTIADIVVRDAVNAGIVVNLTGTGPNVLDFHNNSSRVTGTSTAISISQSGTGSLTITAFNDNTVSGDTAFNGIVVGGVIFDQTPGGSFQQVSGGTTIIGSPGNPVGGAGLTMNSVTGDLLFTQLDAYAGNATVHSNAIRVGSTGVFNAGAGTGMQFAVTNPVNAAAAQGSVLDLQNVTTNLTFASLVANGGTGAGVSLNTVAGSVSVLGTTSLGAATPMGDFGIHIQGSSAGVNFGTSTTIRSTSQGILVGTTTGNVSFGNTTITKATDAISMQNNSSGTRSFGTIDITSTAGSVTAAGFLHAVGGGAVSIGGTTTITDVGGRGIDIQNATTGITFGNTTVNATGGTGVNLQNNSGAVTFSDLDIAPDSGQLPFSALDSSGTLTTTSGTIAATSANALLIDGPAGLTPLNMTLTSVSTTACSGNAVSIMDTSGTITIQGGTIPSCGAASFVVNGGTVSAQYLGSITQANNFATLLIANHATGTLTFGTGTLNATNGTGLQFDNADGTYNFNGPTTLNGGDAGIDILNGSSGTFSFGTGTAITNPSGTAFNLSASNSTVTYSGSITDNTGLAVSIDNHDAGTITFQTGNIASTGAGIGVSNSNAGTVNFNSPSIQLSTGSNTAVNLATNTGGTMNFATGAGAGLDITTTSGTGFSATGGGTVSVTGSGNSINASSGTALNVTSTTIGASHLIFQTISSGTAASSTATGIILDTTGSSGGLHVTGTGSAGTGGTIRQKTGVDGSTSTGIGIYLNSTSDVQLNRMQLNDFQNFAIRGTNVTGFIFDDSVISGANGNAAGAFDEAAISFNNLLGNASISRSNIGNGFEYILKVLNTSGTLNRLTVDTTTFGTNNTALGGDAFQIVASNASTANVTVTNSTFTNAREDLFNAAVTQTANMDLVFRNNTLSNNHTNKVSAASNTLFFSTSSGTASYDISHNTLTTGATGSAIAAAKGVPDTGSGGTMIGTINANSIGLAGVVGSGSEFTGIFVSALGSGTHTTAVTNNIVRRYNEEGIFLKANDPLTGGNAVLNATLTGNQTLEPDSLAFAGLWIVAGSGSGVESHTVNVLLGNSATAALQNDFTAGDPANGSDVFLQESGSASTINLSRAGSASGTAAGVIQDDNVGAPTVISSGTVNLVNTTPTLPPPVAPRPSAPTGGLVAQPSEVQSWSLRSWSLAGTLFRQP